jgi:lipoic acid synthetase
MPLDIKARKPSWLKVRAPGGERYAWIREQRQSLELATVCEEAQCPNIGECWSSGTATFMVMGDICTRGCRFCAVNTKRDGKPLDVEEPAKLARTIKAMDLEYIVVTSVDRDDLPDQGAQHFADCVAAVNAVSPKTRVEILHPDFRGEVELIDIVARSGADVLAHNIETVRSLTKRVRDGRCGYDQSLAVLARCKETAPDRYTKSSIMVGLGETEGEVIQTMRDLRGVDTDFLTLGQYLRPSKKHIAVEEFVDPAVFARYEQIGKELGFKYVASGPLVRSSYKAAEFFIHNLLEARDGDGQVPAWEPTVPTAAERRLRVLNG